MSSFLEAISEIEARCNGPLPPYSLLGIDCNVSLTRWTVTANIQYSLRVPAVEASQGAKYHHGRQFYPWRYPSAGSFHIVRCMPM